MIWFIIWFILVWIDAPWWGWFISVICCAVDIVIALWKAEARECRGKISNRNW